jgi:uncharacterized protein (DUF924 family)
MCYQQFFFFTSQFMYFAMRPLPLIHKSFAVSLSLSRAFATATTQQTPSTFTLNKGIFNETIYSRIRTFWFDGLPPGFTGANPVALKRWWGLDASQTEKQQFDASCSEEFLPAIEALGSENLRLPDFESHRAERDSASIIASPLLAEVQAANDRSAQQAADTLLSLVILLDQIPRNIFRSQSTLPLAYNHCDRLAQALVRGSMALTPSPVAFPPYMKRPAIQSWILMPLLHSEDLSSHDLWNLLAADMDAMVPAHDQGAKMYVEQGRKAWEMHVDPIRKFGRYPHRNACLGRESSAEEKEWLSKGETFGVSQGKDEL